VPAFLVINNSPTRAELMALQSLAVYCHVMTLSPHLPPTMLHEDMCRVRALGREFARRLRKWLLMAARNRTRWRLPPAASTGEEEGSKGLPCGLRPRLIRSCEGMCREEGKAE
jgi:hypothetical protein